MSQDIDSWLSGVTTLCDETEPDMMWCDPIPENAEDFEDILLSSFRSFTDFPSSFLSIDLVVEAKLLSDDPNFKERAISTLQNLNRIYFGNISELALLSFALSKDSSLLSYIPPDSPIPLVVWCLSQCIDIDVKTVMQYIHSNLLHPPPFTNQTDCQAVLLLLHLCINQFEPENKPPFTSDEFEIIFCLAYCSKRSQVKSLAASLLPHMTPLITQSSAAHLLFRRMLPYCAMEDRDGQKMALTVIEDIISTHSRFLTCLSTWVSLHPFCVAASNNLFIDLQHRGLITKQMKTLIKHIQGMNKRLLKGKIVMTNEVRNSLPRSLWRVEFPPPKKEIEICNETCRKISKSIESKRSLLIPLALIFSIIYVLYVFL